MYLTDISVNTTYLEEVHDQIRSLLDALPPDERGLLEDQDKTEFVMWQVVFVDVAEEDSLSEVSYIADVLEAPNATEALLLQAEREVENLATYPVSCPLVREELFATKGFRVLRIQNYSIFYAANEDTEIVSVIRFLYARRNWISLLESGNEGE